MENPGVPRRTVISSRSVPVSSAPVRYAPVSSPPVGSSPRTPTESVSVPPPVFRESAVVPAFDRRETPPVSSAPVSDRSSFPDPSRLVDPGRSERVPPVAPPVVSTPPTMPTPVPVPLPPRVAPAAPTSALELNRPQFRDPLRLDYQRPGFPMIPAYIPDGILTESAVRG